MLFFSPIHGQTGFNSTPSIHYQRIRKMVEQVSIKHDQRDAVVKYWTCRQSDVLVLVVDIECALNHIG